MADYRIYTLGLDRHVVGSRIIEAATDEEALATAKELHSDRALEVWTGARKVGTVPAEQSQKGPAG
jgi:hypothetical protein